LEPIGEVKGIRFFNDSLATIPEALANALDALGEDVETLIAGGHDRGIDYTVAGSAISKSKIKNLVLFPTTGAKICEAAKSTERFHPLKKYDVQCMEDAVRIAFEVTSPGKICLLSPASSSFNLFKDYQDRGDQFRRAVLSYKDVAP